MQLYDEIDYFLAIASARNLNYAAKTLFVSPSALSIFLGKLERRLGVTLFLRSKDSLQLTEAGRIYYESAKRIAAIREETLHTLEGVSSRQSQGIHVGVIGARSLNFTEAVWPLWRGALPDYAFRLTNSTVTPIYEMVRDGTADVGVGVLDYARQETFQFFPMTHEEVGLVLPEQHPLNRRLREQGVSPDEPVDISLLGDEPLLLNEKGTSLDRTCRHYFRRQRFTPRQTVYSLQRTNIQLARITGTATMTSSGYVKNAEGVVFQRLRDPVYYDMGLFLPRSREMSPPLKTILELAEENRALF